MHKQNKIFVLIWIALLVLLSLTAASAFLRLGIWNSIINFGIALAKALLVVLFFMRLRGSHTLVRLVAVTGIAALAILFALSGSDYATRQTYPAAWQMPRQILPHWTSGEK